MATTMVRSCPQICCDPADGPGCRGLTKAVCTSRAASKGTAADARRRGAEWLLLCLPADDSIHLESKARPAQPRAHGQGVTACRGEHGRTSSGEEGVENIDEGAMLAARHSSPRTRVRQ